MGGGGRADGGGKRFWGAEASPPDRAGRRGRPLPDGAPPPPPPIVEHRSECAQGKCGRGAARVESGTGVDHSLGFPAAGGFCAHASHPTHPHPHPHPHPHRPPNPTTHPLATLISETHDVAGVDASCLAPGGLVVTAPTHSARATIALPSRGPSLLSARTTAATGRLVWRFRVTGSTALELGVVGADEKERVLAHADALHRGRAASATGFASRATVASHLPGSFALTRGAVVEVVATPDAVTLTVAHGAGAVEPVWLPSLGGGGGDAFGAAPAAALVPWRGPPEVTACLPLPPGHWRLAATLWTGAALEMVTGDGAADAGAPASRGAWAALPRLPATTAPPVATTKRRRSDVGAGTAKRGRVEVPA